MKNILLMFLGILIALVSLEVLLQTSSFVISQANKLTNQPTVRLADNKDSIKILCIGESTTFAQYPKQLVDYLNEHIHKDFVVIDCGIKDTNIEAMANKLDSQLAMYEPDIVISMMGINNTTIKNKTTSKKYELKTVSAFMFIKTKIENLAEKFQTIILNQMYKKFVSKNENTTHYVYPYKLKNTGKVLNFNTEEIKRTYLVFANKVINYGAIYICMSYPTIPIEHFESFFNKSSLKNKMIFVSNEENFKEKLKTEPYYKLFTDNVGGTFGHSTKLGNTLIAENVGKVIIKLAEN